MKIKKVLAKTIAPFVPQFIMRVLKRRWEKRAVDEWQRSGCPAPPPHPVKQTTIKEYQKQYEYSTFVETGTFIGDMVEAQKANFKKIISIELSADLFEK